MPPWVERRKIQHTLARGFFEKTLGQQVEAMIEEIMKGVTAERKDTIDQILQGLVQERQNLRLEVTKLVDFGKTEVDDSMNHVFLLGAALILIFFLAMFFYRYASKRVIGSDSKG